MSLLKAIGYGIACFIARTIFGACAGAVIAFAVVLVLRLAGVPEDSIALTVAAGIAFAGIMFVFCAVALDEAIDAIKTRPRGLGLRQVTKWKDGSAYYDWEKY